MVVGGKPEQKQRLRVIFENGTESSMYRQSLSIRLFEPEGPGDRRRWNQR